MMTINMKQNSNIVVGQRQTLMNENTESFPGKKKLLNRKNKQRRINQAHKEREIERSIRSLHLDNDLVLETFGFFSARRDNNRYERELEKQKTLQKKERKYKCNLRTIPEADEATFQGLESFFGEGIPLNVQPLSTEVMDSIESMFERLYGSIKKDFAQSVGASLDLKKLTLYFVAATACYYVGTSAFRALWRSFCSFVSIIIGDIPPRVMNFIRDYFSRDQARFQGRTGDADFVPLLTTILGLATMPKFDMKHVLSVINGLKRNADGFRAIGDSVTHAIKQSVKAIKFYLLGDLNAYDLEGMTEQVSSFLRSVNDWELRKLKDKLPVTTATYEGLKSLLVTGKKLQAAYDGSDRIYDEIKVSLRIAMTNLAKLLKEFDKQGFGKNKLRPVPLTILLKGKSGVGKSAATTPLIDELMIRTFKTREELDRYKENNMDFIYSRNVDTEYWDGYFGQKAVVYDDFMQANDSRAQGAILLEPLEIIRITNLFPFLLHNAHLEDKGNNYFDGRIVLCSTNNWELSTEILREHEALVRRFHVQAEVYPKVEHCTQETSSGPLHRRRLAVPDTLDLGVYEFHLLGKSAGSETRTVIDYWAFADHLVKLYNDLDRKSYAFLKAVEDRRLDMINKIIQEDDAFSQTLVNCGFDPKEGIEATKDTFIDKLKKIFSFGTPSSPTPTEKFHLAQENLEFEFQGNDQNPYKPNQVWFKLARAQIAMGLYFKYPERLAMFMYRAVGMELPVTTDITRHISESLRLTQTNPWTSRSVVIKWMTDLYVTSELLPAHLARPDMSSRFVLNADTHAIDHYYLSIANNCLVPEVEHKYDNAMQGACLNVHFAKFVIEGFNTDYDGLLPSTVPTVEVHEDSVLQQVLDEYHFQINDETNWDDETSIRAIYTFMKKIGYNLYEEEFPDEVRAHVVKSWTVLGQTTDPLDAYTLCESQAEYLAPLLDASKVSSNSYMGNYTNLAADIYDHIYEERTFPSSSIISAARSIGGTIKGSDKALIKCTNNYNWMIAQVRKSAAAASKRAAEILSNYPVLSVVGTIATILLGVASVFGIKKLIDGKKAVPHYSPGLRHTTKTTAGVLKQMKLNMQPAPQHGNTRISEMSNSILRNNEYVLLKPGGVQCLNMIAIGGSTFIFNTHLIQFARKNISQVGEFEYTLVPLTSYMNNISAGAFKVSARVFADLQPSQEDILSDLSMIDLGRDVRPHKNIVSYFINEADFEQFEKHCPMTLVIPRPNENTVYMADSVAFITHDAKIKGIDQLVTRMKYAIDTQDGDCGSVGFINDPSLKAPAFCFHSAGKTGAGYGIVVTQEKLRSLQERLMVVPQINDAPGDGKYIESYDETYCGLPVVRRCKAPHMVRETKLRKSVVYGWAGESTRAPAVLKPVDGVDPFELALSKYATPNHLIDNVLVSTARADLQDHLNKMPVSTKRLLTFEEAVAGIHGNRYINGIPRKTSAGYPYCLSVMNGKKEFFGADGDYDFSSSKAQELKKIIERQEQTLLNGGDVEYLFMDMMKDELRTLSKIEALKTRMISCSPLDYSIICKMYFGTFIAFLMENKVHSGSAIGVNPFSHDWTDIVSYLGGPSARIIAGDFSGFDTSQGSSILWSICDLINNWYDDGDVNRQMRIKLFQYLIRSYHVHGSYIVAMDHCLPSGHILTTVINTLYNLTVFRIVWMIIMGSLASITLFRELVHMVAYGDDNISGVDKRAIDMGFNYRGIITAMAKIGHVYTSEDKEAEVTFDYKLLQDCTFLKRGFQLDLRRNMYFAPLELSVVLEMPYWYRRGPNIAQRMADNIDNCLRELAIHGEATFDTYSSLLLSEAYKHREHLSMTFAYYPWDFYLEKAFQSWVDAENNSDSDFEDAVLERTAPSTTVKDFESGHDVGFNHDLKTPQPAAQQDSRPMEDEAHFQGSTGGSAISETTGTTEQILGKTREATHVAEETTGFSQDAAERLDEPFPITVMKPSSAFSGLKSFDRDATTQFLRTPVNIRTLTVTSSNTQNTTIGTVILPFDPNNNGYLSDSGMGMWLTRLNAFQGMRATAVVKIQINCNRLAQGRLLVHYIPGQGDAPSETAVHRFNLMTKSQTPNVQIDLNRDTSSEFRIPYISAWPAYDLTRPNGSSMTTTYGQMGSLFFVVYSPLVGATTLNVNVWLHFEDVELFNPTYAPQANGKNITDAENNNGVISGPLMTISKAAGVLGEIPSLSSLAGSAAWFTDACAKAARAFGFSKPDTEASLQRMVQQGNPYVLNMDGEIASTKFGYSCQNKLDVLPGFAGNDIDEHSIEYIANRPAFMTNFSWSTSTTQGTSLWSTRVGPNAFVQSSTIDSRTIFTYTPFALLTQYANQWRADYVITIKVVKTEFHTGKLVCSFRPSASAPPATTPVQENYLVREVLDLKESSTFVIKIPYVSITPWMLAFQNTGTFNLSVFNPLNAPAAVSSAIDVIIEISAENVQLAGISSTRLIPAYGNNAAFTPQASDEPIESLDWTYLVALRPEDCPPVQFVHSHPPPSRKSTTYHFQADDVSMDSSAVATREKVIVMGGMKTDAARIDANRYTTGEVIFSIKAWMNRFCRFLNGNFQNATYSTLVIDPFSMGGTYDTTGTWVDTEFSGDYLSALASGFAYFRGSVRIMINGSTNSDFRMSVNTDNSLSNPQMVLYYNTSPYSFVNSEMNFFKTTANVMVGTVNQWAQSHSRESVVEFQNVTHNPYFGAPNTKMIISDLGGSVNWNTSNNFISRSAGDDFQFGFFIGFPPMYVINGPQ